MDKMGVKDDINKRRDLGASVIEVMETEWYAAIPDPNVPGIVTVQCRICPWSVRFDDYNLEQIEHAVAAFIAHAKRLHKHILKGKVNTEKL